jgi:DNA-binding transcriptional LysR family regulator
METYCFQIELNMNLLTMMETFASVVETGSFTAAAEQLGLSKSFVSKQVSQLESELGTRLLYRTTRKLSVSDEGTRFYNHCKLIVAEADNARAEIIESQSVPRGKIRITVPQSLIITDVGRVLLRFQHEYPDIELDIIVSGKFLDLIDKNIDLAIRVGQLEDSMLVSRRLVDCFFQVVASPQYINKWGKPNHPEDLTQHNCLVYGVSRIVHNWPFLMPNGETIMVKAQGNLTCNDGNLIVNAALEDLGIGFGPSFLFNKHLDVGTLQLLLPEYQQPTAISALYPYNRNLPRRIKVLIDFLAEHLSI